MCKCTPNIRTPFCGKGDCVWPEAVKPQDLTSENPNIRIIPKDEMKPYYQRDHVFTPWQGDPNICGLCALSINLHHDRPKPEVRTDTLYDRLLPAANRLYKELKMQKHPYKAPEFFPDLGDTGKAILKTLCDHLESKKDAHGFIRG